jgi:hypothetical protein
VSENFTRRASGAPSFPDRQHRDGNTSQFAEIVAALSARPRRDSVSGNFTADGNPTAVDAQDQALAARREGRHRVCNLQRSGVDDDSAARSAMKRYLVATLLLQAASVSAQETGLSKGPVNPADIGTRCAVMAGRDDRAYLNCLERHGATVSPPVQEQARNQRPYTDHPGDLRSPAGRYPRRGR